MDKLNRVDVPAPPGDPTPVVDARATPLTINNNVSMDQGMLGQRGLVGRPEKEPSIQLPVLASFRLDVRRNYCSICNFLIF
jgi:hypothetical protein